MAANLLLDILWLNCTFSLSWIDLRVFVCPRSESITVITQSIAWESFSHLFMNDVNALSRYNSDWSKWSRRRSHTVLHLSPNQAAILAFDHFSWSFSSAISLMLERKCLVSGVQGIGVGVGRKSKEKVKGSDFTSSSSHVSWAIANSFI